MSYNKIEIRKTKIVNKEVWEILINGKCFSTASSQEEAEMKMIKYAS